MTLYLAFTNQTTISNDSAVYLTTATPITDDNATSYATNSTQVENDSLQLVAILVPVIFGVIFCVGCIANIAVIAVNLFTYQHQNRGLRVTNTFILNLAIADLCFLVFCVPFQATIYSMDFWPFGTFMCVFCEVCQQVAMLASIFTLVALSLDRFFAVVYATSAKQIRTRSNVARCLAVIWAAALSLGVPSAATKMGVNFMGRLICALFWFSFYHELIFICGYVTPLLVIVICYVAVLHALRLSARRNHAVVGRASKKKNRRVTRIVVLLVVVFALSWLPHHLLLLWLKFGEFPYNHCTFVLRVVAHCLSYANSCLNPLIYGFVSASFRRDFVRCYVSRYSAVRNNVNRASARISTNLTRATHHDIRKVELNPRAPTMSAYEPSDNVVKAGIGLKLDNGEIVRCCALSPVGELEFEDNDQAAACEMQLCAEVTEQKEVAVSSL